MKHYLVEAGKRIVLVERNPDDTQAFDWGKEEGIKKLMGLSLNSPFRIVN